MRKFVDVTGQRFGLLVAIKNVPKSESTIKPSRSSSALWLCRCDCGSEIVTKRYLLKTGRAKSCGCLRWVNARAAFKAKRPPGNTSAVRRKFKSYQANAAQRSLPFEITIEQFHELVIRKCSYCGSEPDQKTCNYRSNDLEATLVHNGIDRIDNCLGYIPGNVATCCRKCNKMKTDMTLDEFKTHISKIHACLQLA